MSQNLPPPILVDNNQAFQIFALTAFCTVDNLRKVAGTLDRKDPAILSQAPGRNEKIPRLCQEMEEQVLLQLTELDLPARERKKLLLMMEISTILQRMGDQTVEVAALALPMAQASPQQISGMKKMLEHAVYLTDKMATGFLEEKETTLLAAREEGKAADLLFKKLHVPSSDHEAGTVLRIIDLAHDMVGQSLQLTGQVQDFLHDPSSP